jgi:polar amino acid transport system substrate-binding protein
MAKCQLKSADVGTCFSMSALKYVLPVFLLLCVVFIAQPTRSFEAIPAQVPTLVPPTLVPVVDSGLSDALPSESVVARIQTEGKVRVGILFNAPPFGELNIRGEVSGYDADLARSMAEIWGVEAELVQVTRQTAIDMLTSGAVDMLLATQTHRRGLDSKVEFSQTYYRETQSMMVREADGAQSLTDMANRKVGVVIGTSAEEAVNSWQARSGVTVTVQPYLTLDQAFVALVNSEIDGVVDKRVSLFRAVTQPGVVRILDEPVMPEPYAVVMRRQDVNLRNLVNRTLQYLVNSGRMNEIYQTYFPDSKFPLDTLAVWSGLGEDAPTPAQFATDIPFPTQYVVPRLQSEGVLRVAGLATVAEDAPESERRLDAFNRSVVEELVTRWGLRADYLPDSAANALDLLASGQADLAVGVEPNWSWADRVDFTGTYFLHGDRIMAKANSDIEGFDQLRGKWIAVFVSEPQARDRVKEWAESVNNVSYQFFDLTNEADAIIGMTAQSNYDVVYGDSLKLIPHVQADPEAVRLTTRGDTGDPWYSRTYVGFAVPRNDLDFRLLVEYTLQEMGRDGALANLLTPVMMPEDIPTFEFWPGSSDYLGFQLARAS